MFCLSGCGERHCIKPESLSNLREKLDIVSTQQKWVNSAVHISDTVKVTEISIVPNKLNFCPDQYKDFTVANEGTIATRETVSLPFALKEGDSISFSILEHKICKSNENDQIRHIEIDKKCGEKETEHFAKILNQEKCQSGICPNKYAIGNAGWLDGKEYSSSGFSNQDEKRKEIENIINSIKQGQDIDCSKLSDDHKSKIDTYVLNMMCKKVCTTTLNANCVEGESYLGDKDLFNSLTAVIDINSRTSASDDDKNNDIVKLMELFRKEVETNGMKTYIPSLQITMANEDIAKEDFEHLKGSIRTNYDYTMENDHHVGENLTLIFGSYGGKGGYNMRVTKSYSLKDDLYISVSDKLPEHNPGESSSDISVDINKVNDSQYMEDLQKKLKSKNGTIYYGVRDHGCSYKNGGEFNISLTIKEPPRRTFSAIYKFFDERVKEAFFGSSYKDADAIHSDTSPVKSLYQSFVASNRTNTIRSTIISLLVLFIVLYTLYYFFGLSHSSIYEFLLICVRIGIIAQLLQDNSWNFFYNNAFSIFVNTPKELIEIANFRGTTSNVFEFLDLPLNRFFSPHSVLLIVSLIFSGPLGIVAFCLVIWGLITVVLSIFNALFSFVTSIAIIALLLSLAPIFIICALFKYTRKMFTSWISTLARFAIHPVIILIFISLISQVMDYIVYSVFDFEVCTTCIFSIDLKIFKPCFLYAYASKYTPNITAMMSFVILGHAMKALIKASSAISDSLFNTYVPGDAGQHYKQSLLGVLGLDQESAQRRGGGGGASQSPSAVSKRPQIPQAANRPQIPSGKP